MKFSLFGVCACAFFLFIQVSPSPFSLSPLLPTACLNLSASPSPPPFFLFHSFSGPTFLPSSALFFFSRRARRSQRLSLPENIFHPHANQTAVLSLITCVLFLFPFLSRTHTPKTVVHNQSKRQLKLKGKRSLWRWMEGLNINWMRLT